MKIALALIIFAFPALGNPKAVEAMSMYIAGNAKEELAKLKKKTSRTAKDNCYVTLLEAMATTKGNDGVSEVRFPGKKTAFFMYYAKGDMTNVAVFAVTGLEPGWMVVRKLTGGVEGLELSDGKCLYAILHLAALTFAEPLNL